MKPETYSKSVHVKIGKGYVWGDYVFIETSTYGDTVYLGKIYWSEEREYWNTNWFYI